MNHYLVKPYKIGPDSEPFAMVGPFQTEQLALEYQRQHPTGIEDASVLIVDVIPPHFHTEWETLKAKHL